MFDVLQKSNDFEQPSAALQYILAQDRFLEAKRVHKIFAFLSIVYLGFGVADYYYIPDRFQEFMFLRCLYCIVPVGILVALKHVRTFLQTECLAAFHAFVAAGIITYMISTTLGFQSAYYAGLNLVAVIALCFFTFSRKFFWITAALIYGPYFILSMSDGTAFQAKATLVINAMFTIGTVAGASLIHHFREVYRLESLSARFQLKMELDNRDEIIQKKTEEAVNTSVLSSQFSPQVIEAITQGRINLDTGGEKAEICVIFIDIVNSTEQVTTLEKGRVSQVLSRFLDDASRVLLKYDITIDKFLGDGVLGFCNAPLPRERYCSRVVSAALDIREEIGHNRDYYREVWGRDLKIRIGIAKGTANVGFYGSRKYFRSYTAIGPVTNLASRICSSAEPDQILISEEVFQEVQNQFFIQFKEKRSLKGFEQQLVPIYEVTSFGSGYKGFSEMSECSTCGSILLLESNQTGELVFMCKSCCSVINAPRIKS